MNNLKQIIRLLSISLKEDFLQQPFFESVR